jgi:hypothetical protein
MSEKDTIRAVSAILFVVVGLGLSAYFGGGIGVIAAILYGAGASSAKELNNKINTVTASRLFPSQN